MIYNLYFAKLSKNKLVESVLNLSVAHCTLSLIRSETNFCSKTIICSVVENCETFLQKAGLQSVALDRWAKYNRANKY